MSNELYRANFNLISVGIKLASRFRNQSSPEELKLVEEWDEKFSIYIKESKDHHLNGLVASRTLEGKSNE